jgi:tetratricopeptide repeat protein
MGAAVAIFLALLLLSFTLVAMGSLMAQRLTPDARHRHFQRWLIPWSIKGLAVPAIIWFLMNLGLSWQLQPFMPQVQAARNGGGPWFPDFLEVMGFGVFVVSSYWTALTLGWFLISTARAVDSEPRQELRALFWTCLLGLSVPAAIVLLIGGWPLLGLAATVILGPMAGYAPSYLYPKKLPPIYARAIARMKFGKYTEAEWEIIHELERCEDDFEGWMMLADLYANHFHDLVGAERTILELCDQPKVNASQLSVALHRLADWHLKLGRDPNGARRALRLLADRLKGTHLARMALLRIDQLPETAEELREQQSSPPIPLPALGDNLDRSDDTSEPKMGRRRAAQLANACVETLKRNPNHVSARQKLARIFAEHLERADLGIEQIDLLLSMPSQPEAKRAEWLGLVAAWHLKYRQDRDEARKALERLVKEFPTTTQAMAARYRLEQMDRELRAKVQSLPTPKALPKIS